MDKLADNILDCALRQALNTGWENMAIRKVAAELEISLADISRYYRSKDDLAEALFDRADQTMLAEESSMEEDEASRLQQHILCWLAYLAPYRRVVREIMAYKFEPGHIHLQAHGVTRVSRTVQWFLTAANCQTTGLKRVALEIAVTGIYLRCFAHFLFDHSEQQQNTRRQLNQDLNQLYRLCPTKSTAKPSAPKPAQPD